MSKNDFWNRATALDSRPFSTEADLRSRLTCSSLLRIGTTKSLRTHGDDGLRRLCLDLRRLCLEPRHFPSNSHRKPESSNCVASNNNTRLVDTVRKPVGAAARGIEQDACG